MPDIDRTDLRILESLTKDGRLSWRELSDEIGLTLTPTLRRVRQLEESGIIKGYTAILDESRLLGSMAVFISVTLERQIDKILENFETQVSSYPEIMGGYLMSGTSDYMLHAYVRDLEHYMKLLDRLTHLEGIAHIQTSFVLKTFTRRTSPMVTSEPGPR